MTKSKCVIRDRSQRTAFDCTNLLSVIESRRKSGGSIYLQAASGGLRGLIYHEESGLELDQRIFFFISGEIGLTLQTQWDRKTL